MTEIQIAYQTGFDARFVHGRDYDSCPYRTGPNRKAWQRGWRAADFDLNVQGSIA